MDSGSPAGSALRPLTLNSPGAASIWREIAKLKAELESVGKVATGYKCVEADLGCLTDEVTRNTRIPIGRLAKIPGQIVHLNEVTIAMPTPEQIRSVDMNVINPETKVVTAKRAKEIMGERREAAESKWHWLKSQIEEKEKASAALQKVGMEEAWGVNEKGEVLNEEGLPMFDIQEMLPEEPLVKPAPPQPKKVITPTAKPRYILKTSQKKVVTPTAPLAPASPPVAPSISKAERSEMEKLFAELEIEEIAEAEAAERAHKIEEVKEQLVEIAEVSSASSSNPPGSTITGARPPAPGRTPSVGSPFGFRSGFLSPRVDKGKGKVDILKSLPVQPQRMNSDVSGEAVILHEPHHHSISSVKSIYKPTPPPSAPSSRPGSPRLDRKVVFDASVPDAVASPKKKSAILLPPPPALSAAALELNNEIEEAKDRVAVESKIKAPVSRPVKGTVLERPVKAPTPARVSRFVSERQKIAKEERPPATMGRPPKAVGVPIDIPSNNPPSIRLSAPKPIHTISLSNKSRSDDGIASLQDIIDDSDFEEAEAAEEMGVLGELEDEEEEVPVEAEIDDEENSDEFYAEEEDEEDYEDMDIDGALHAREMALAYHRARADVGAGAGTGPLGGDADPNAFDAWNQPEVPLETTLLGRVAGNSNASRFRKGRLETAQMIIPGLVAQHAKQDNGAASDDENDGLSQMERENIARTLAQLAAGSASTSGGDIIGRTLAPPTTRPKAATVVDRPKAPPTVVAASSLARAPLTTQPHPVVAAASVAPPQKKMSRFKARQLGLEVEE